MATTAQIRKAAASIAKQSVKPLDRTDFIVITFYSVLCICEGRDSSVGGSPGRKCPRNIYASKGLADICRIEDTKLSISCHGRLNGQSVDCQDMLAVSECRCAEQRQTTGNEVHALAEGPLGGLYHDVLLFWVALTGDIKHG